MKIAVVTPRFREPAEWVAQCVASVRGQTVACTHIVVNDGGGRGGMEGAGGEGAEVIELPVGHADYGNAARSIGAVSAVARGFEAIAFLDADNWYEPSHVESLVDLHARTGAGVCASSRMLHGLDGRVLGRCPEVDGVKFVDTNCLMVFREAFRTLPAWFLMPREYAIMGDRYYWEALKQWQVKTAYSGLATVHYRTGHKAHYEYFGVEMPAGVKELLWEGGRK